MTSMNGANVLADGEDGGHIFAPNLVAFTGSTLRLRSNDQFTTGPISDITGSNFVISDGIAYAGSFSLVDNARFTITESARFSGVNATSYTNSTRYGNWTVDGIGSVLDLSSLEMIRRTYNSILANQGFFRDGQQRRTLDLSNLQDVIRTGSGRFSITADTGGQVILGQLQSSANVNPFVADGVGSQIHVLGDVILGNGVNLTVTDERKLLWRAISCPAKRLNPTSAWITPTSR